MTKYTSIPPPSLKSQSFSQTPHVLLKPRPHPLRPVRGEADVRASQHHAEKEELEQEPAPAAFALLLALLGLELLGAGTAAVLGRLAIDAGGAGLVQVLGRERDEVVVVGELARLGAEAQVRDGRDLNICHRKAFDPVILRLVLQLQLQ